VPVAGSEFEGEREREEAVENGGYGAAFWDGEGAFL
jgi:hypothetical protein